MSKIGYARVSSPSQNLDRQIQELTNVKVDKIFQEKISGKNVDRPQLIQLLNTILVNDEVVVCSLDRIGRNSSDIKNIMQQIQQKGATVTILNMPSFRGIENRNLRELLNSLIIDLFSYVAESEREMMLERQRQGIEIAKRKGVYKGRKIKFTPESKELTNAIRMYNERKQNKLTVQQIAVSNGMSKVTLYRKLKAEKKS
ncbi:recombinase family protein [Holzapfeliella floricola]|uniref:Site-specific recombinase, DNA invertase Pin related protein n=1 Tax=Holzapfeliella floricola DSM 23037 = JCM 16512 TaxID=1423744 RepID=A0A0R2DKK4_9LACO|nr:recombinase family protein [Holzapfeliella floricola]KRN04632.1 site-specific recombinase, DNA invertase Pin related protein [Holzapfeliella floricola DSM 23037 = JCM 16512]